MLLCSSFLPVRPFFAHTRVGRGGQSISGLSSFARCVHRKDRSLELTVSGDRRVTRIGRLLRRFKLDELPQLLNILTGSMTFVGPRPESPKYVALYTPAQREILDYQPGLTDPASLKYRYEEEILAGFDRSGEAAIFRLSYRTRSNSLSNTRRIVVWFSDIKISRRDVCAAIFRRHDSLKKKRARCMILRSECKENP